MDFMDFLGVLLDFFIFPFYSSFSKKKEWGVQFSHFPISDKFSITKQCKRKSFFFPIKVFIKLSLHYVVYPVSDKSFKKTWVSARIFYKKNSKKRKKTQKNTKKHDFWLEHENARKSPIFPV